MAVKNMARNTGKLSQAARNDGMKAGIPQSSQQGKGDVKVFGKAAAQKRVG